MTTNSIPEGCKPFDLERALAGDPVVTRDGQPVTQLVRFDARDATYSVYGVVNDAVEWWCVGGRYLADDESRYDLFMTPKKRKMWVNLYPDNIAHWHDSEEEADHRLAPDRIGNRAWPVEIEE